MATWAMEEFARAELGDGRLRNRLIKLATSFTDKPTASIPGACNDWAEPHAVYRFFDQASGLRGHGVRPRIVASAMNATIRDLSPRFAHSLLAYENRSRPYPEEVAGASNLQYFRMSGGSFQHNLSIAVNLVRRNRVRSARYRAYSLRVTTASFRAAIQ